MHTVIVGAGALGAMYGVQIASHGFPVSFAAQGERAERLRKNGLVVNGIHHQVSVVDPSSSDSMETPAELVIVALKHDQLPEALPAIATLAGRNATILSVMNGIDSERQIREAIAEEPDAAEADVRVLHCMVAGMDAVREGLSVLYTRMGTVFVGRRINRPEGAVPHRLKQVQTFFSAAEIPWKTPENMEHAIWNKFMLNVGINQWSAVLGAPYGVFHTDEDARQLMRQAMSEVLSISNATGVALTQSDLENWFSIVDTLGADGKTSMLQDVEAGRKTEVEMFAGRIVSLGDELRIPTPVNSVLLHALRAIERSQLRT